MASLLRDHIYATGADQRVRTRLGGVNWTGCQLLEERGTKKQLGLKSIQTHLLPVCVTQETQEYEHHLPYSFVMTSLYQNAQVNIHAWLGLR